MDLESVADLKLAARAFNEGWDIPVETGKSVVAKAAIRATCGDPEIEHHAGKLLLDIAKFNHSVVEAEQKRLQAEHARKLQLIELAIKLGPVPLVGGAIGIVAQQSPEVGQ